MLVEYLNAQANVHVPYLDEAIVAAAYDPVHVVSGQAQGRGPLVVRVQEGLDAQARVELPDADAQVRAGRDELAACVYRQGGHVRRVASQLFHYRDVRVLEIFIRNFIDL